MTTEIHRPGTPYVYRQNPDNPCIIDRKLNKARARWESFRLCKSEDEARAALLKLGVRG